MTLSFLIKRKYLAQKVEEQIATGVFHERREFKSFWRKRIGSVERWKLKSSLKFGRDNDDAVFLCGRYAYYADILNIRIDETPSGIEDVVPGKLCYTLECKFPSEELEMLSAFLSEEKA